MRIRQLVIGILPSVILIMSLQSGVRADILVSNLSEPFKDNTPIASLEYWAGQSLPNCESPIPMARSITQPADSL